MADVTPLTRDAAVEGSLLIPKTIYNTLIEQQKEKILPRELAGIYVGPNGIPGSSIDIDLVEQDSMKVFRVAEGAVFPIETPAYTSTNVKPVKYGLRPFITKEMMEDAKWDMLAHSIKTAGVEMAENENLLVEAVLDAASNAVSCGATVTIANITRGMQYLEDNHFTCTDLIVTPEIMNDLRNLDLLAEAHKEGGRTIRAAPSNKADTGYTVYGMRLWVTDFATTTKAYIIDREFAYCIVEKRPVTVNQYNKVENDMVGAVISQRIKVKQLRDYATCELTSS